MFQREIYKCTKYINFFDRFYYNSQHFQKSFSHYGFICYGLWMCNGKDLGIPDQSVECASLSKNWPGMYWRTSEETTNNKFAPRAAVRRLPCTISEQHQRSYVRPPLTSWACDCRDKKRIRGDPRGLHLYATCFSQTIVKLMFVRRETLTLQY